MKNEFRKVILLMFFYNISHKHKNVFNNNKLLKKNTFIIKTYYNKPKIFITKNIYINIYIVKKIKNKIWKRSERWKDSEREQRIAENDILEIYENFLSVFFS